MQVSRGRELSPSVAADLARVLRRGKKDPVWFIEGFFIDPEKKKKGARLWRRQIEIIERFIVRKREKLGIITGPKTGKTWVAAAICLWAAVFIPNTQVRLCAPTEQTLIDALYKEIVELWYVAAKLLPIPLSPAPPAVDPKKGIHFSNGSTIISVSATKETAAQGKSGANQIFVVDEAVGYPPELWAVIFRNLMGGGQILALSNHTHAVGIIYEAATLGVGGWEIIEFQVTENPNFAPCACGHGMLEHFDDQEHCQDAGCDCQKFRPTEVPIPGLANPRKFHDVIEQYGKDSPYTDIALGRWPRTGGNTVVPFGLLQLAEQRQKCICGHGRDEHNGFHGGGECRECICPEFEIRVPPETGLSVWGIDPAEFGTDDTGIVRRRGNEVDLIQSIHGMDAEGVVNGFEELVLGNTHREPQTVYCDKTGNDAVYQELYKRARKYADTPAPWSVIGVNFGEKAWDTDRFCLVRDQLWWGARLWLKDGGALPHNGRLFSELAAPSYSLDARQRIQVEKKKEIKKKLPGGKSPDLAEAFILSLLQPHIPLQDGEVEFFSQSRYGGWGGM